MKRPDFFVVGAPKCGTTALTEYLRHHPDIFFSTPKELNYFAADFDAHRAIRDSDKYHSMFAGAQDRHKRVGEGSVLYLYSSVAIQGIHDYDPAARIIVMVRNPIDMIPALHQQYLAALYEDERNLERAWDLQEERAHGRHIPRLCRQPELLAYRRIGMLGEQLDRLWTVFPREQTLVIVFDDFVSDTRAVYQKVLAFLGLEDDGRVEFPRINEAHGVRPGILEWLVRNTPVAIRNFITRLRYTRFGQRIPAIMDKLFKQPQQREQISPDLRKKLVQAFSDDIAHLGNLLGRDLTVWLRAENTRAVSK